MVEMELREVHISETSQQQILILEEKDGTRAFPIFIGLYEAVALDHAIHKRQAPRPMTHDLVCNAIEAVGGQLDGVLVDDLSDDTFFGKLLVSIQGKEVRVDSRPSDAIVLAMKKDVPIYVAEAVLESATNSLEEE